MRMPILCRESCGDRFLVVRPPTLAQTEHSLDLSLGRGWPVLVLPNDGCPRPDGKGAMALCEGVQDRPDDGWYSGRGKWLS